MKTKTQAYSLKDIPKEAWNAFLEYAEKEWEVEPSTIKTFDDVIECIRDWSWGGKETVDSCYINQEYMIKFAGWKFEIWGSSYRKDQSVCDEKLDDFITVTNLKAQKEANKKAKEKGNSENRSKWEQFVKTKSTKELLDILQEIKFPIKEKKVVGKKMKI